MDTAFLKSVRFTEEKKQTWLNRYLTEEWGNTTQQLKRVLSRRLSADPGTQAPGGWRRPGGGPVRSAGTRAAPRRGAPRSACPWRRSAPPCSWRRGAARWRRRRGRGSGCTGGRRRRTFGHSVRKIDGGSSSPATSTQVESCNAVNVGSVGKMLTARTGVKCQRQCQSSCLGFHRYKIQYLRRIVGDQGN